MSGTIFSGMNLGVYSKIKISNDYRTVDSLLRLVR